MTPELGHFALILALIAALAQTLVPAWGLWKGNARAQAVASSAAQVQFLLIAVSFAALTWAFIQKDFSVAYVADNSHSKLPLVYRISAVWGAHEGSLLLWGLMLSGWTLAVSLFNRRLPAELSATAIAVLGAVSTGFLLFMLITSNPFERIYPVPLEGRDLNPLLQDPGLIIHPPMLYMGYVGFSVAFAYAIAALITGKLDAAWVRWTRPWTTAAWAFLTMGITLGSWWAYNELGWGGWWFWDPVENASFMPWLAGTALIHSLAVTEKRGLLKSWTVLLAILAFALSLLGTFLVRSGVLVSVHAFASDPARGVFILGFLAVVIGSALSLYAWRAPKLATDGELRLYSREGLLLLNNVFLVTACFGVLLGTLYPLVVDALALGKISVGPPYFNAIFFPLIAPLFVLVAVGAVTPWKKGEWRSALRRLRGPALLALAVALVLPGLALWLAPVSASFGSKLTVTVATWLALFTLGSAGLEVWQRLRAKRQHGVGTAVALASVPAGAWGMTLSHLGLGLWMLGVAYVTGYGVERDVRLSPGASAELAGYEFAFEGVRESQGPNFTADAAHVTVTRAGRPVADLAPEKRFYPSQRSVMTESGVDARLHRDLYVALGEPLDPQNPNGDWSLRLYYKPAIRLVWLGGVLMFFGGLIALSDRRYRLGARAAAPLPAASLVA
ncbi:heme lyase CcmF/NrfE family subunit [Stagnimonas aquatica]|uniref:Heme lyase CcmF/NrfE family subunit n=1 Tax=Stagnimonas aquatica TaxID=2689987 RepID=A0A3N0V9C6_9GAMM|nr:heme lyase CcmF/NrfE family subunit [Stagnimonas aquatica]ROH89393.1 heme lyase CcmF/NrfE family subunit [Stagnimonas aquatica]